MRQTEIGGKVEVDIKDLFSCYSYLGVRALSLAALCSAAFLFGRDV